MDGTDTHGKMRKHFFRFYVIPSNITPQMMVMGSLWAFRVRVCVGPSLYHFVAHQWFMLSEDYSLAISVRIHSVIRTIVYARRSIDNNASHTPIWFMCSLPNICYSATVAKGGLGWLLLLADTSGAFVSVYLFSGFGDWPKSHCTQPIDLFALIATVDSMRHIRSTDKAYCDRNCVIPAYTHRT